MILQAFCFGVIEVAVLVGGRFSVRDKAFCPGRT